MFYLCALWLWTNWLFWRAGRSVVACDITVGSVAQRQAGSAVFGLLDAMRSASQVWAVNHAVRAVTTVVIAESYMQLSRQPWRVAALDYTTAAVFFLIVLSTAAAPGYVTTHFYETAQCKLAAIAHTDGGDGDGDSDDEERGELQLPNDIAPTSLIQRVAAAGGGTGMHFAGVPMTVEKAIAVGTALLYLTRYFATATN
jgi:hypothetical protein